MSMMSVESRKAQAEYEHEDTKNRRNTLPHHNNPVSLANESWWQRQISAYTLQSSNNMIARRQCLLGRLSSTWLQHLSGVTRYISPV